MKAVPLSRFMPYGAPELLGSARRHMLQALFSSMLVSVLAFALAGMVARSVGPVILHERIENLTHIVIDEPPPEILPQIQQRVRTIPVKPFDRGDPIAVKAEDEPPPPDPGSVESRGEPDTGTSPKDPGVVSFRPPAEETLPPPGQWVFFDEGPEAIRKVEPEYPGIAKEAGVTGTVALQVLVGRDGRVVDVQLDARRNSPMLNDAAVAAARQWVFKPALANGRAVAVWVGLQFKFVLH